MLVKSNWLPLKVMAFGFPRRSRSVTILFVVGFLLLLHWQGLFFVKRGGWLGQRMGRRAHIQEYMSHGEGLEQNPVYMNVIVSLRGRLDRLQVLIDSLTGAAAALPERERFVRFIVVNFDAGTESEIGEMLKTLSKNSKIETTQIEKRLADGGFSRAGGIAAAIDAVDNPEDLIFVVDVDIVLGPRIFHEIKRNVLRSILPDKIYFPVVRMLRKGEDAEWNERGELIVHDAAEPERAENGELIEPEDGIEFWNYPAFGVFAVHKFNYLRCGGFVASDLSRDVWGKEDNRMFDNCKLHGVPIQRSESYSMAHIFHSKRPWGVSADGT